VRPAAGEAAPAAAGPSTDGRGARPFTVLLGPDYAGKSSVLRRLAADGSWTVVSYDRGLLDPNAPLVGRVRDEFFGEALKEPGRYSPDLVLTIMQVAVVHLRDQVAAAPPGRVIVDSYYYKILAKCRLLGLSNEALFSWWRGFPQPDGVVFLDVPPHVAWRRSGCGADVNGTEYYGDEPTEAGFRAFQTDLRQTLLAEVADRDVTVVAQPDGLAEAVETVERATRSLRHV
jgi:thymidylate kinase